MLRFFLLFLTIQAVLFVLELWQPVREAVIIPFTGELAALSAWLIGLFDDGVVSSGIVLTHAPNNFAVRIEAGCNGVEAMIILIAAILAFPASWKHKAIGLALVPLTFAPLAYTWNLPLLYALILAVRPWRGLAWKLPQAYAALLPVHVWGVLFKFLLQVNVLAHPDISAQIGMSDFGKTLVVLGNQFGYLMLPVISTAVLWIGMNQDFVRSLQNAGKQTASPVENSD